MSGPVNSAEGSTDKPAFVPEADAITGSPEQVVAADGTSARDSTSEEDIGELMARYRAEHDAETAALQAMKPALMQALKDAGIGLVNVHFNGSGDEGQIETIEAWDSKDAWHCDRPAIPLPDVMLLLPVASNPARPAVESTTTLTDALEELVYDFLGITHAGWQDGDGAYGDVVFTVETGEIKLEYSERYIETNYHEHVL